MIGLDTPDGMEEAPNQLEDEKIERNFSQHPGSSSRSHFTPQIEPVGIQFDVTSIKAEALYGYLEVFKETLSEFVGFEKGKEISFDELLNHVFERLEEYTSDELIGLALYLVNLLLIHRDNLPEESAATVFENIVQLIEISIESKNSTALFIAIEVLGRQASSRVDG
jgi:hypothetical protein